MLVALLGLGRPPDSRGAGTLPRVPHPGYQGPLSGLRKGEEETDQELRARPQNKATAQDADVL
jgi:hypothetical protein